ncbi:hypothetical protein M9458_038257 [Cirrhinus mrigala]|uniref:Uncharacterized protein n=1 Tax=Cirrhinus mrigala TaxID=683832 RepID=A0ABD0P0R9_CIRMR
MNDGGSHEDKAEKERETLGLKEIKIKERGQVQQKKRASAKFREMQSLQNLMEGESEHREAGEKKKKRKLKERKTTEPAPLLVEVKLQQTQVGPPGRSPFLKPIEAKCPMLPSVSEYFALPAARFKPLPPVTELPMCPQKPAAAPEEVTLPGSPLQVDPPSVSEHFARPAAHFKPFPSVTKQPTRPQKPAPAPEEVTLPGTPLQVDPPKPLVAPPRPTPAHDELFSLRRSQVSPPKRLAVPSKPTPAPHEVVPLQHSSDEPQPITSSLFEPPPQLMLTDIEDEENEYMEYTGKTIRACDLLNDNEVLEEVRASEVVEVLGFEEEKDDPNEMGDSKATEGHLDEASQNKKEMDEHMKLMRPSTIKRKVPLVLFTWAEEKAKKKEEKKIRKEKEQRDNELLLERYKNDPKLRRLLINKHNRHYRSSE